MATDSTGMTIDFLRARLLSERSVSRASRERADQLAQRVVELEEQLRIVTTQRKKAEKATAEVLAILESQGVGYITEPEGIDSSSDQDEVEGGGPTTSVTKEWECDGNSVSSNSNSKGKDETSNSNRSTVERSEVEDEMSGSELDAQAVAGSLSWKGRSKSPDSNKKHRAAKHLRQIRPRHIFYFTSPDPSPKYQRGKSCRRIKPKDLRCGTEDEEDKRCSDGNDKGEGEIDKTEDERTGFYVDVSREEDEMRRDVNGNEGQMERALEEQAQLIDQFQAEENAQREWEKMYSQNRNDDFESENKGCIGESVCEDKEEIVDCGSNKTETLEEANASPEILFSTEFASLTSTAQESTDTTYEKAIAILSDGNAHTNAPSDEDHLFEENNSSEIECPKEAESVFDDSTAGAVKENTDKGSSCTHDSDFADQFNKNMIITIPNSPSSQHSLSNSDQTHEENPLALQLYEPPPESCNRNSCGAVEDVLEALRRAKMSLRENLSKKLCLRDNQLLTITDRAHDEMDSYSSSMICSTPLLDTYSMNIPVGSSSGLFRLPTDDTFTRPRNSENSLSLGYSSDLTNVAREDYFRMKLLHDIPSAFSGSSRYTFGSSSNFTAEMPSLHTSVPRFYEESTRALPAGDRLFFDGGDSSFSDLRML
ncbi:transcriptional regulator ATRX [Carex rostrata]